MKAARWHGRRDVRIDEIDKPQLGPYDALVKVSWCGICGTDLKEIESGPVFIPTEPHPVTGTSHPVVLGHEFSGTVHSLGTAVEGTIRMGDRVTVDLTRSCGVCRACTSDTPLHCANLGFIGTAADGAFAEYVAVPASNLHLLPESVSDVEGALIEPFAFAVHAIRRSEMQLGDRVAVVGAGPIGLMTITAAKAAGASEIYCFEPSAIRRDIAAGAGATSVIDPANHDDCLHADIAFECVGLEETLRTAIAVTRRGGTIVAGGVHGHPAAINFNDLVLTERRLIGTLAYSDDFPRAISLVASQTVDLTAFVTSKIALDDILESGFDELVANKEKNIKVLVSPQGH